MNKYITPCAKAKINKLIGTIPSCQHIKLQAHEKGGFEFIPLFKYPSGNDIIISYSPLVTTDFFTLSLLKNNGVDFSYPTDEFIVSIQNVISTNA